jgi:uncharacterized delta-60 repeat protein
MRFARSAATLLFALSLPGVAAPTPDPGFGSGGTIVGDPAPGGILAFSTAVEGLTIDRLGRILHFNRYDCGYSTGSIGCNNISMQRRAPDGTLDISLNGSGTLGLTILPTGYVDTVAAAIDPSDRIIIAETYFGTTLFIRRYFDNGHYDLTFGTPDSHGASATHIAGLEDIGDALDVGVQPDGRIVLVLGSHLSGAVPGERVITLVRLDAAGHPDPSFGPRGDGIWGFNVPGGIWQDDGAGIAMLSDGRFYVVSRSKRTGSSVAGVVSRHLANGSLDPTFGSGGWVIAPYTGVDVYARRLAVAADGSLLVTATLRLPTGAQARAGLLHVKSNGTIDTSFSSSGWSAVPFPGATGAVLNIARQPDGKPVVVGYTDPAKGTTGTKAIVLRHELATGNGDPGYGVNGIYQIPSPSWPASSGLDIAVDSLGRMVVSGTFGSGAGSRWFLTRLVP